MTYPRNPHDRLPRGDKNRRLSLGASREEMAAAAGITVMRKVITTIGRRTALAAILAGTLATPTFAHNDARNQQETDMRVRIEFNGVSMTAVLYDNPSARDFASMLPLDLELDNYGNNEKIAYLPRKLTEEGSGPIAGEAPGDLAYYAPWGNIILYYADWSYTKGLIRLGRIEGGIEPLLATGKAAVHIELVQ